jgi:glycosyltransferase involved in cell wall biosynthesis
MNRANHLRVLEVTTSYLPKVNGTTLTVRNLLSSLSRKGHDVLVFTRWRSPLARRETGSAGTVYRIGVGRRRGENLYFLVFCALGICGLARKNRVDAIHAHGLVPGMASIPARIIYRVPFLLTFHQEPGFVNPTAHGLGPASYRALSPAALALVSRFATYVSAQSRLVADAYSKELRIAGPEKIVVLPNPITPRPMPKARAGRSGSEGEKLLYVGNLAKNKGVDLLLRAMPDVIDRHPGAYLVAIGRGPQLDNLRALAKSLGISDKVIFRGEVLNDEAMACEYSSSKVLVLPSFSELFGLVLAEALSLGIPVISTDTIGAKSIVRPMENGLIIESRSHELLAKAIDWVLSNPLKASKMGSRGPATVEHLALERVGSQYERILSFMSGVR